MNKFLVLLSTLALTVTTAAQTTLTFNVNDQRGRDVVTFTSKAPLETIIGKTSQATGFVTVDIDDVMSATTGKFSVDLASLKTGIDMRDGHMRDNYLETAKYPNAVFEMTKVISADSDVLTDQTPVNIVVDGNFSLHGITKAITIPLTVTYFKETESTKNRLPGDLLHIVGTFDILLSDYNIERPQFVILKVDQKQKVDIDLFGSTGLPAPDMLE